MNNKKMNPVIDPEKMLPEVQDMIYSQAWKFAKQYPITFEEAKAEAYFAFVRSCYDYKAERGQKFSTWCYYWVWAKLKDLITARSKDPHVLIDLQADDELERRHAEEMIGEVPDLSREFFESIEEITWRLGDDAKKMLDLILEAPKDLLKGKRPTPRQLVTRVRRRMLADGMLREDVDWAQAELQKRFGEALAA